MLEAFTLNEREAKYPADLVACWASMCDIKYGYNKKDSLSHALFKVKAAIRKMGIQIFDFIPTQMDSGYGRVSRNPSFFAYIPPHSVSNTTMPLVHHDSPLFTGRADTLVHIAQIFQQDLRLLGDLSNRGVFNFLSGAFPRRRASLRDVRSAASLFRKTLLGEPLHFTFHDQAWTLLQFLAMAPENVRATYDIWQFYLPVKDEVNATPRRILKAWTMMPHFMPFSAVKIARESRTGATVVLTITKMTLPIVAYLLVTDQLSGTHVLRAEANGVVNLPLEPPMQRDMTYRSPAGQSSDDVRHIQCQLCIDEHPTTQQENQIDNDVFGKLAKRTRDQRAAKPEVVVEKRRAST